MMDKLCFRIAREPRVVGGRIHFAAVAKREGRKKGEQGTEDT